MRKVTMKMWRSVLSVMLALSMMLAPCTSAFATENAKEKINYVSLGDSMTNGYCFTGYEQGNINEDQFENGENVYGYEAYPNLVAEELAKLTYKEVNHSKLAVSAMRAEDLNYLLGGREMPTDGWFSQVEHYSGTNGDDLKGIYQDAIKEADVISMGIGNAAFGAYMVQYFTRMLGVMGGSLDADERVNLEKALEVLDPEQKAVIMEAYNQMMAKAAAYVPNEVGPINVQDMIDMMSYIGVGFILNYEQTLEQIMELNPDAEVILVGLMNTTYGMTVTGEGFDPIPVGDIMNILFGALNAYIAGLPAAMQAAGQWEDAEFYYAENTDPEFIVQVFDDMYNEGWPEDYQGLSGKTVRERTLKAYNNDLREMIATALGMNLPAVTLEDVANYTVQNYYQSADPAKEISITIYLALEEALADCVDSMEITLDGLMGIVGDIFGTLGDMPEEINPANNPSPSTIKKGLVKWFTGSETSRAMCKIFAMFKVGDGMSVHPTPKAHRELADAIIDAYTNGGTAKDKTLENLELAFNELAALIKEYGPEIANDAYTWAQKEGYIEELEAKLEELKVQVKAEIENIETNVRPIILEKIVELEAELEALKADLATKVAEFDAMLKDLNAKLAELKAELEAKKAELENAAEEAKAEIEKAIAEIEAMIKAIEKAIEDAKAAVEAVKAQIEAVKAEIEVLKTQLADINEKLEALYNAAVELDAAIRELIEITKEGLDADLEDVEAAIQSALNKVEKTIVVTQEAVKAVADFIADIQAKVEAVVEDVAIVKEAVEAVYNTYIAALEKVNADIKAALETIKAEILAALEAVKAELNAEAMAQIEAIKAALEEKIAAVRAEIEALYAEQLAVLEGKIAELEAAIAVKKAELENAAEGLKAEIEAEIARLEAELAAKKAELEALLAQIEAEISAAVEEFKAEAEVKIAEINAALEEAIAKLEEEANAKLEELNGVVLPLVKEAYAALETEIAKLAETITTEVEAELAKIDATIKATAEEVKAVVEEKLSEMETALTETFEKCRRAFKLAYYGTLTGEYVADEDSYYVSLGDSTVTGLGLEGHANNGYGVKVPGSFSYKLAKELGVDYAALGQDGLRVEDLRYILDETYVPDEYTLAKFSDVSEYRETIKAELDKADLVTIGIGSNNFTTFAAAQIGRILAGEATYEMDWSRFVTKEGVPAVEKVLELIKDELVKAGMDTEIALGDRTVNAADAVTKVIECYAYGYAGFAFNYAEVFNKVHEINPEALVVVVGGYNTLDELNIDLGNGEIAVGDYLDKFLALIDIHFTAYAMMTPNTTYVTVPETETIFDANTADKEVEIDDYLLAMITDNGKAMHASDAGHTYIKNRIYDSLIKKETVNGFWLESDSWKFTGKEIRPLVLNRFGYVEGYDFNVEYVNNVEPGNNTAKVVITGLFDDVKDTELSFTIKVVENFITADKGTVVPVPETGVETEDGTVVTPVPEKDFDLSDARIEAMTGYADSFDQVYTGKALKPAVKVYHGTDLLVAGKDYTVSYKNNTKAFVFDEVNFDGMTAKEIKKVKIPTITIKGKGNYTGTQTIHFDILRKDLADVTYTYKDELMYSGKKLSTSFAMKNGTVSMKNKTDYTVEYFKDGVSVKEVKAAGEYTMVVTGKGNYEGALELPISVKATADGYKALSKLKISTKSVPYGNDIADGVVVKDSKTVLTNGVDYVLEYDEEAAVNAGKHKVVVRGIDKYVGSKTVTVTVKGISLAKATVKGLVKSVVYTGEEFKPNGEDFEVTLKVKEGKTTVTKTLVENVDYVITYSSNVTNKGTIKLTFKGIGNYTGSFTKSFTVAAYKLADAIANGDIEIVVDDAVTFNRSGAKAGVKVLFRGEELVNGKDYTLSYSNTKKVFDYEEGMTSKQLKSAPKVVVKAKGNFSGSFTAYYDIEAKDFAELTVVAPNVYYANKKGNFKTTVTVVDESGKKLTSGKDYKVTYVDENGNAIDSKAKLDAGTAVTVKVTAVAGKGYAGEQTADIRILQAKLSNLKISKLSFWYTGEAIKLTDTKGKLVKDDSALSNALSIYIKTKVFPGIEELVYGEDFEIVDGTYAGNVKKGTASVTIKGIGNYAGTYKVTYKIVARPTWLNIYDKLVK